MAQLAHTAFRVETLADLREMYRRVLERRLPIESSVNHGCSLAFYFRDPEHNMIEVYWASCIHNHQPYGDPLDLTLPETVFLVDGLGGESFKILVTNDPSVTAKALPLPDLGQVGR